MDIINFSINDQKLLRIYFNFLNSNTNNKSDPDFSAFKKRKIQQSKLFQTDDFLLLDKNICNGYLTFYNFDGKNRNVDLQFKFYTSGFFYTNKETIKKFIKSYLLKNELNKIFLISSDNFNNKIIKSLGGKLHSHNVKWRLNRECTIKAQEKYRQFLDPLRRSRLKIKVYKNIPNKIFKDYLKLIYSLKDDFASFEDVDKILNSGKDLVKYRNLLHKRGVERYTFFLKGQNDNIIGMTNTEKSSKSDTIYNSITGVYKAHRGKHYGSLLKAYAYLFLLEKYDYEYIETTTNSKNVRINKINTNLGFQKSGDLFQFFILKTISPGKEK